MKIEFRDPEAAKGFTQIENSVMFNPNLSCGAVRVYGALKHYAYRQESPRQEQIAADLGISMRSLGTYCKELEKATLLTVKRHFGKPSSYIIESAKSAESIQQNLPDDSANIAEEVLAVRPGTDEDVEVSNETSPTKISKRKPDPLWDAFVANGLIAPVTTNERSKWNAALKQLREIEHPVQPEEIAALCRNFRTKWPLMTLTPIAISSNLSLLRPHVGPAGGSHADRLIKAAEERNADRQRGSDQELPPERVAREVRELRGRRPALGDDAPGGHGADGRDGAVPLLFEGPADRVPSRRERSAEEGPLGWGGILAGPGHSNGAGAPLEAESASSKRGEHPPDERAA